MGGDAGGAPASSGDDPPLRALSGGRSPVISRSPFLFFGTRPVSKILSILGATIGGMAGWWLGAFIGTMTAFIVSTIASGFGIYYGRRIAQNLMG